MSAARTEILGEDATDRIVIDVPMFEAVSIESVDVLGQLPPQYIEIPLHLVPDVLTALMKAARCAAIDMQPADAAAYADARAVQLAGRTS